MMLLECANIWPINVTLFLITVIQNVNISYVLFDVIIHQGIAYPLENSTSPS